MEKYSNNQALATQRRENRLMLIKDDTGELYLFEEKK
jgi:hypothetical protein